jgi:hypothetical protein
VTNRIPALSVILLAAGCVTILPRPSAVSAPQRRDQTRPLRCTKQALAALIAVPKLEYECEEQNEDNLKSPERRAAMQRYLRDLESSLAGASWWDTSVDDLGICSIVHEARLMTDEERRQYSEERTVLCGDRSTRLVLVEDPCIWYSASALNAYILERAAGRVYATQVLNAYFTRVDRAVDMSLAQLNGETLILVETHTSDGFMPPSLFTTCYAFTIDPRSHRAVPKKLFKQGGKLTYEFKYDDYLFDDEELAKRWRAPSIIQGGTLAPRFYVYRLVKHHFVRDAYVWNGKCYSLAR